MEAFLKSQGGDIWSITQEADYVIPAELIEAHVIAKFERNSKVVNLLFASLDTEYRRKFHLDTTREIWAKIAKHHEGTATFKAWLFFRHTDANMRISHRSRENLLRRCMAIFNWSSTSLVPTIV